MEAEIAKLNAQLGQLYKERGRLAGESYSQSNPSAVMERRDNRRSIERAERKLETLQNNKTTKTT